MCIRHTYTWRCRRSIPEVGIWLDNVLRICNDWSQIQNCCYHRRSTAETFCKSSDTSSNGPSKCPSRSVCCTQPGVYGPNALTLQSRVRRKACINWNGYSLEYTDFNSAACKVSRCSGGRWYCGWQRRRLSNGSVYRDWSTEEKYEYQLEKMTR